jgi:hypothetical protein
LTAFSGVAGEDAVSVRTVMEALLAKLNEEKGINVLFEKSLDIDVERSGLLFDHPIHSNPVMHQLAVSVDEDCRKHVGVHFWFIFYRFGIGVEVVTVVGCVVVVGS